MSANFKPVLNGYSGQGAFRFWCQKVLPLVYDDSLSYYELLNKVVVYLNNTIADVAVVEENVQKIADAYGELEDWVNLTYDEFTEKIENDFATLQNFVNTYFDNLDVQEEINTKLDEMASDGSLSTLLAPYIPSLVTAWLNENVDPVGSAVMVDSSLTISGAAADAKVTGDTIDILREDLFYNSETLNTEDGFSEYPITKNALLRNDGNTDVASSFITTDFIPIKCGKYKITKEEYTEGFTVHRCTYNSQRNFIEYVAFVQDASERFYTITSPDIAYVRFSVSNNTYDTGISFRPIENLKDTVNMLKRNVYGNLCGSDPTKYYPVSLEEGDYLTLSTSDGSTPTYIELQFYDENYSKLGVYSLSSAKRTVQIESTVASAKYIKWSSTPSVPIMVEFGIMNTEYKDYDVNIFSVGILKENVNRIDADVYGNLCGNDSSEFYPVRFNEGEFITLSSSTGATPSPLIDLQFYDENYIYLGAYTLNSAKRTVTITPTIASARYIKWSSTPDVPLQVEFGAMKTAYKEYNGNIFQIDTLLEKSKKESENVYTYGPLPIVAVMSYNVGEWYDGTRTEMPESEYSLFENIQNTILKKNYASIFCAQEYYYAMYSGAPNAKDMFLYPLYSHVATMNDTELTHGKAFATNLWIESVESVNFVNQSGVGRQYQKAYVYINGHKVCICNVHLSQLDSNTRLLETDELVNAVRNEEYFIVLGDFNAEFDRSEGIEIINKFDAIGAKPCNCGDFGTFYTYRYSSVSSIQRNQAIDNIFVSSNITIKSVYMDMTKIDANLPIQDHVPLITYLEIF